MTLTWFVAGTPRPKGSLEPQIVRGGGGRATGRVRMVEGSPDSTRWRRTMAMAFRDEVRPPLDGPVVVSCGFWFDRSRYGPDTRKLPYPTGKTIADLDKLVRNVLDALTDAQVYFDDRQVVMLGTTGKFWCIEGDTEGVKVSVWRAEL